MEMILFSPDCIRIKGKSASFVIDPTVAMKVKTQADAILLLTKHADFSSSKVEEYRVIIGSIGEYEVSGAKITGFKTGSSIAYSISLDDIDILLIASSDLPKLKESSKDYKMIILYANELVEAPFITVLVPSLVVLYGEKAEEILKILGKETVVKSQKLIVKKEQLLEEMEVAVLG